MTRTLGLDPSLTNFGWAIYDDTQPTLPQPRGRLQTASTDVEVDRYVKLREGLIQVIRDHKPDNVGLESPVFGSDYSEGLYALFIYCQEAIRNTKMDVVFWSPLQIKAHARESLGRPKGWVMMKPDMVEAARKDVSGVWNHNEADAYLCAKLASRFFAFEQKTLKPEDLTVTEQKYFTASKTPTKGKNAGQTLETGMIYREGDRWHRWGSQK